MSSGPVSSHIVPGAMVAGKYRVDALIGEGGMGSVWSATHLGLGQSVAIKFVSREFVRSAEAVRRFDAEAKAAAQLRSRHVVQVFDTGTLEDGTPYIAMELLHGETLQTRVHRAGPIPLSEAVNILSQCCKALGRAHGAGIIHRDIKPDNIFLAQSQDDDTYLVKILDFGVAKMGTNPNDQGAQGATRTGAVLGTPLYMSPEQARGLKTIDHRTDLYSLGLVAYTMFTGNLAFSSESFGDLLLQICTAPLPSLCAAAQWLPPTMEAWFQRACARDPQDRYASAQEFADALRTAAGTTMQSRGSALPVMSGPVGSHVGSQIFSQPQSMAQSGTSAGISRTGDAFVPPKKTKAALAIVAGTCLLLGGAGAAGFVVFGRGPHSTSHAGASPATSASATAATGSPPTSSAASLEPTPRLDPPIEPPPPSVVTPPAHSEKPLVTSPGPQHANRPPPGTATSRRPGGGTAPAGTVDLGY
jgi:serine/threonine-protein kinase